MKKLTVVGPLRCKGMTADVVFLSTMKRQRKDTMYRGMATDQNLLGIHYTRSRVRTYALVHDLTSKLQLPPEGKLKNRGLSLLANMGLPVPAN